MERNLYDDELEDFLKQKANQYKIYPSDKVWTGIYTALHTGRKWHIIGGALLLLSILTLISLEKVVPNHKKINTAKNNIATPAITASYITNNTADNTVTLNRVARHRAFRAITKAELPKAIITDQTSKTDLSERINIPGSFIQIPAPSLLNAVAITDKKEDILQNSEQQTKKGNAINWLAENIINKLLPTQNKRLNIQFYLSPSISYRSLQSGKLSSGSQYSMLTNRGIRELVDQTPALGLELGSTLQLHVTDNVMLKTGLQFNYVRYNISAYRSSPEKTSITLSGTGYYSPPTTITTYSTLRNFNGGIPETIQNQYVQLSLPIGAEWKVLGGKRLQLNIAGSIQPSYLLMNSAYMLTSDFSNYTKEPSLVRRWNVNAGVETFVSYKMGSLRWQIGPQFRYQLLSSYTDRYPIREYLMEYGMKIGLSKTIK